MRTKELTGSQKAAAILVQLGTERAEGILRGMSEAEAVALTVEIANLPTLNADQIATLMEEFVESVAAAAAVAQGGIEVARELLATRVSPQDADELLEKLVHEEERSPVAFLEEVEPNKVASFLATEHPQTIALLLASLPPDVSAAILAALPEDAQADVSRRIALMDSVEPATVNAVASVLQQKVSIVSRVEAATVRSGVQSLVAILNKVEQGLERGILTELEEIDGELADRVRSQMFVFEDILTLDDKTLQKVLRQVPVTDLAVSLKGYGNNLRDAIMRNLSERAGEDLIEQIENLGPVRKSTVEIARIGVVKVIRELEAKGEIILARGDEELIS